jgi:hypothetical protein
MEAQLLSFRLALRLTPPSPHEQSQKGGSGCTGVDVELVKAVRQGVAIEGETQAEAAGAKWAGSMGGGWSESWTRGEDGADDGGSGEAAMRRRVLC